MNNGWVQKHRPPNITEPDNFLTQPLVFLVQNTRLISGCPYGYTLKEGDIPGWGQLGSTTESTIVECSNRCNDKSSCCSFEYSPTKKRCNLNRDCEPTEAKHQDYAFCTKTAGIRLN